MAIVLVADPYRDLRQNARHLIEGFGAVVEPVNVAASVYSPDLIKLGGGAPAHRDVDQKRMRYFAERVRAGMKSPDCGMDIKAKDLVSASRNAGESALNLLKMLCRCWDDQRGAAD